ncbi:EAL domain-containing protein [Rhodopila globiformis]|uniref:Bifunctional diguanylate cyclase/phosphodiesterase n=1 Tax=Rhodopila globiformis TaxID=1071 RepID=A0A2S6MZJ6_RHOGL|nr:EAL domain-containing protein [Rhodopila globiformis]PPQ27779.1 hypothetical protein CCS01_26695 [Rhodopila globiformis]
MLTVFGCIVQQHDLRLVALAGCICILATGTTTNLLALLQGSKARFPWAGLMTTSIVFGCGVWALHFVAMLAYMPGMPVAYSVGATLLSIVLAAAGTFVALVAWTYCPAAVGGPVLGGILLGFAISGMHYCGVLAMRVPGTLRLDTKGVLESIVIGIVFATLAFARAGRLNSIRRRVETTIWLALSICGVHFTGMAALHIDLGLAPDMAGTFFGSDALGVTVGIVSFAILTMSLFATILEQSLSRRGMAELQRMRRLGNISREVLVIHRDGVIVQVNAAGERMFGRREASLIGRDIRELIPEKHRCAVLRVNAQCDAAADHADIELARADGSAVSMEVSAYRVDYEGKPAVAMVLRDLTAQKRDAERIRHLVLHDALTGLPNRFLLQERLTHMVAATANAAQPMALLHLGLRKFKQVNDAYGYEAGDALLVRVAGRLKAALRPSDLLARLAGDEFLMVALIGQPDEAASLGRRIGAILAEPFRIDGHRIDLDSAIGVALYPGDAGSAEALMQAANLALSRARNGGRNACCFFEPAWDEQFRRRHELAQDLRRAIAHEGQLRLLYQPLVSCETGEIEGFEALIRWRHPGRGEICPATFIPVANETGLIVELGEWVLETACRAAASWDKPLRVAVNISPIQFRHVDLVNLVSRCLGRHGLPASRLEVEVTEDVMIQDTGQARDVFRRLREVGVGIALDDFGTGYSGLSYLQAMTFDKLKIDRSFVARLGETADALMIVRAIIGLGHNLGLSIIAEGVETVEQLEILKGLGCDQVQGYLLGRPMQLDGSLELVSMRARSIIGGKGHEGIRGVSVAERALPVAGTQSGGD